MSKLWLLSLLLFSLTLSSLAKLHPNEFHGQIFITENQPIEIHFQLPLNSLIENSQPPYITENSIPKNKLDQLKFDTQILAKKFLIISQNNQNLPIFVKEVTISSANSLDSEKLNTSDLDLSFSVLVSNSHPLNEFSLNWQFFPNDNSSITFNIVTHELKKIKLTHFSPSTSWQNPTPLVPLPKPIFITDKIIILPHYLGATIFLFSAALLLLLLWIFLPAKFLNKISLISFSLISLSLTFLIDWSISKTQTISSLPPNESDLKKITHTLLAQTYSAASSDTPFTLFSRLNQSTAKNFLDESFRQIYETKALQPEVKVILGKITILKIKPLNFQQIQCSWQIDSYINHHSHNHSKTLKYNGLLTLNYQNDNWQITDAQVVPLE